MEDKIRGIHHVTAITADAQENIDFYCGVLGLRLVKLTVNYDDPTSYHLYYGDGIGRPGTIMTFFVWPGAYRGIAGPPQVTAVAFAVQKDALDFWRERLAQHNVEVDKGNRFGEGLLSFNDPDGLRVEIIAAAEKGTGEGSVERQHAIRGFHGITIAEEGYEETARLVTGTFRYLAHGQEDNRFRYRAQSREQGSVIDLVCTPTARLGSMGAGVVHHVAYRTPDDQKQLAWRDHLKDLGLNVTPVINRVYFHSIYFREPGGVLFEIATDGPGFTVDEPAAELGAKLALPPWLEPVREKLERFLPEVHAPEWPATLIQVQ